MNYHNALSLVSANMGNLLNTSAIKHLAEQVAKTGTCDLRWYETATEVVVALPTTPLYISSFARKGTKYESQTRSFIRRSGALPLPLPLLP